MARIDDQKHPQSGRRRGGLTPAQRVARDRLVAAVAVLDLDQQNRLKDLLDASTDADRLKDLLDNSTDADRLKELLDGTTNPDHDGTAEGHHE